MQSCLDELRTSIELIRPLRGNEDLRPNIALDYIVYGNTLRIIQGSSNIFDCGQSLFDFKSFMENENKK